MATTFENFHGAPNKITHIIRMFNTNIDGTKKVVEALTQIRGIGKRMSEAICKRVGVDIKARAGELPQSDLDALQEGIADPVKLGIPKWMLNHSNDIIDGTSSQLVGNQIDANLRLLVERGKKIRHLRIIRLATGLKVNGQRTKSNGRGGTTVGVSRKK